jgi:hypothetical protein
MSFAMIWLAIFQQEPEERAIVRALKTLLARREKKETLRSST